MAKAIQTWGPAKRLALMFTIILAIGSVAARVLQVSLPDADKLYSEKSYGDALKAYEALEKSGEIPANRKDDVEYRIVVSLGKTQQWDRAQSGSLAFVKSHRQTAWEPRGLYWMGRLYLGVPHQGWRIGKRIIRGADLPKDKPADAKDPESDAKPERVNLAAQDIQNAKDALEASRVLFDASRDKEASRSEEVELNFDLARLLADSYDLQLWAQKPVWAKPDAPEWNIDPAANYDPKWPAPKRIQYLYARIPALAEALPDGGHLAALSLFGKALWLKQYHNLMASHTQRYEQGKWIHLPYPYENQKPDEALRTLIKTHPNDTVRDQAQYTLVVWFNAMGNFTAAANEATAFLNDRPASKWTQDAKQILEQITLKQLALSSYGLQMPGKEPKVNISFRNLTGVQFRLYRTKLEDGLHNAQANNNPLVPLNDYHDLYGHLDNLEQRFGPPVAAWMLDTKDKGDYAMRTETVTVPISQEGTYLLEASAPGIRSGTVLLVTDLALVQKVHRDGALCFVSDAVTGAPVSNAHVTAKQFWYEGNTTHSAFTEGDTNADGLLTVPLLRGPNRSGFRVQAAAVKGPRSAITESLYTYDNGDNPNLIQAYSVTDRSVYRPTQRVYYRQLVMRHTQGELKPVVGARLHIDVYDPAGKIVHTDDRVTSEFGSIKGEFDLSPSVPLGVYSIRVTQPQIENGQAQLGGNQFRVEEYKKPEFEVTVVPTADRVRLGEPTSATVHAAYYFGGPVPGAKVSYRVYRNYWAQTYRFPRAFDFLYNYNNSGEYNSYYRNGAVIVQGEAQTDANGDAKISFPTKSQPNSGWNDSSDVSFAIDADVQDASRRVISGSGSVKATRRDVAVFMDFPHGYATKGDRVDVEVITLNPSDVPVSVKGTVKVYRQPRTPDEKETVVFEEPLKTDKQGRGLFHWNNAASGYFRVAFEARDTAEQDVAGSVSVWVAGPELAQGRFLFSAISLLVENPYYEEDQTARVLLLTPQPDTTVLLIREANNEILSKDVIHVTGRSLEIKVPLSRKDVPNVYLTAIAIRDGQMFQATQELFVPPVRQFANITVQTDKQQYQPGEKAKLHLTAHDWQGKPLRTELSVGVTDASLNYIQKNFAQDVRVAYYGSRRSMSNPAGGSFGAGITPMESDTQARGKYETHEWLLPEGMGMLPDWPGGERRDWYFLNGYMYGGYFGGRGGFGGLTRFTAGRKSGEDRDEAQAESAMDALSVTGPAGPAGSGPAGSPGEPYGDTATRRKDSSETDKRELAKKPGSGGGLLEPALRTHFSDTAFWSPAVITDAQGNASVEVTWPDNLTQWRAAALGTTTTAQVGSGEARVTTRKDLIVRLEAPRFFVERDTLVLSGIVQNYLPQAARVKVKLDLGDDSAEISGQGADAAADSNGNGANRAADVWVDIPKSGEKRVDWHIHIVHEGSLRVRMTAQTQAASDSTEMIFPVLVHGIERATAQNGAMREQDQAKLAILLPKARKTGSSELIVNLSPSLATIMLDALPYLNGYPYGCVEQTMSRFLPSVIVAHTLKESGYDLETLGKRAKLLDERAMGAQKRPTVANSPYSYPQGQPGVMQIDHLRRPAFSPVFDTPQLKHMTEEGLMRLTQFQHADGGWGWWPQDTSDPFMTAYVLYGLQLGKKAGYPIDQNMIDRGLTFLERRFLEDDNFHRMAYEARTLAMDPRHQNAIRPLVTGRIFTNRERLSAYSKALLAISLQALGDTEKAQIMVRNLQTTAIVDEQNGTANWGAADRYWWHWYNDKVETNAAVLQAYMAILPTSPMPQKIVKWLVNNRRANSWNDTRATAMAVYALAEYAKITKELDPDYTLSVDLGGRIKREYKVNRDNALFFDNEFVVPDALLRTGAQTLTIKKQGRGSCYYAAYTRYFSLEDPIPATGNEIYVTRRYFRLLPDTAAGQPKYQPVEYERPNPFLSGKYELLEAGGEWAAYTDGSDGPRYDRKVMKDGETVKSGDLLEVELHLEAKNDYEYLAFEDFKPAGCEPVDLRSGGKMGLGVYSNMELRDQKVAFFVNWMPQGRRTLTYRLRAEIPGQFHILPANGYAMYAPDIRAISDEIHLRIKDAAQSQQKTALR